MFMSKKARMDWPSKQIWKMPLSSYKVFFVPIKPVLVGWSSSQDKTKNSKSGRKSKRRSTFDASINLGLFSLRGAGWDWDLKLRALRALRHAGLSFELFFRLPKNWRIQAVAIIQSDSFRENLQETWSDLPLNQSMN